MSFSCLFSVDWRIQCTPSSLKEPTPKLAPKPKKRPEPVAGAGGKEWEWRLEHRGSKWQQDFLKQFFKVSQKYSKLKMDENGTNVLLMNITGACHNHRVRRYL